ncbi:MAG TPA: hypothetical protein VH679_05010, partial [Vicinamibacterales bacterium]
ALTDAHGNEQAHRFLLSLIRDPRFAAIVNDIVVEFGSARYQDVIDRFVRGEDVPHDSLRKVWQDTTQPSAAADLPLHEDFFRAVRAINAPLPRDRQLRVLLGDPPIDWDSVQNREDHFKWIEMRDAYPAALVQLEVIAKTRRALLLYGLGHFQRKNVHSNFDMDTWPAQTIVSLLERSGPTRIFTIWTSRELADLQADVASWRVPSLAIIRGTALGAIDAAKFFGWGGRSAFRDGKIVPVPKEEWRTLPAEEQFDAILYLGPPSAMTQSQWSPALCADAAYMEMRLKRIAVSGIPQAEADRLKKYCASVAAKDE